MYPSASGQRNDNRVEGGCVAVESIRGFTCVHRLLFIIKLSALIECEKVFMERREKSVIADEFFLFHLQTWVWLDFMKNLEISVMSHCTLRKSNCAFRLGEAKIPRMYLRCIVIDI